MTAVESFHYARQNVRLSIAPRPVQFALEACDQSGFASGSSINSVEENLWISCLGCGSISIYFLAPQAFNHFKFSLAAVKRI